jgi:hypothetical protein
MRGPISPIEDAVYDILIRDADGRHLELESFLDLESARLRLPSIAAKYPEAHSLEPPYASHPGGDRRVLTPPSFNSKTEQARRISHPPRWGR